ncbi:lipocalin-like domain-containing protein [Xylanibacter brevis]|uniref:lipocalin-like domain-containing protein n=1 Tax=Xylanibacter brevis TaxID=83231 RepID=UPI000481F101|nr:lipocalin-like domain-containing protein [Xylanibacter brevis]
MKRYAWLIAIGCMLLTLAACDWESSDNGNLDGFWQMTDVDTLATGGHENVKEQALTWSFQGCILEVRQATHKGTPIYIFKFSHEGDVLKTFNPYLNNRDMEDPLVEDVKDIEPFGFSALSQQFKVLKLTGSRLILQSPTLRLTFRKY